MSNPFRVDGFVKHETHKLPPNVPVLPGRIHGPRQQWLFAFPNGYGASVVTGWGAYGTPSNPYELAVLHDDDLCYSTPLTDDVIGYLTVETVNETLAAIAALPEQPNCTHGRKEDEEEDE